jgi:hypothetical protein
LFLMVCSWVFLCFCTPCSLLLLCSWVFFIFSCFWWYAHGFFDAFCTQQIITTDSFDSRSQQIIITADLSR